MRQWSNHAECRWTRRRVVHEGGRIGCLRRAFVSNEHAWSLSFVRFQLTSFSKDDDVVVLHAKIAGDHGALEAETWLHRMELRP